MPKYFLKNLCAGDVYKKNDRFSGFLVCRSATKLIWFFGIFQRTAKIFSTAAADPGYCTCEMRTASLAPMTTAQIALLTGAGFLAYKAFSKTQSAGTLNFYPASIKNIQMDGVTPVLTLGLAIQNPSSQTYIIKAVVGSLYANNILIGNVSSYVPKQVIATGQTIYPLNIRLSLLGIVQDILQAFQGGGVQQRLELNAYANVDDFNIPIKLNYTIP